MFRWRRKGYSLLDVTTPAKKHHSKSLSFLLSYTPHSQGGTLVLPPICDVACLQKQPYPSTHEPNEHTLRNSCTKGYPSSTTAVDGTQDGVASRIAATSVMSCHESYFLSSVTRSRVEPVSVYATLQMLSIRCDVSSYSSLVVFLVAGKRQGQQEQG